MHMALSQRLSGGYVAMHEVDIDRAERNIGYDCVDKLQMGGKTEK